MHDLPITKSPAGGLETNNPIASVRPVFLVDQGHIHCFVFIHSGIGGQIDWLHW
jgi:hypothetical protein